MDLDLKQKEYLLQAARNAIARKLEKLAQPLDTQDENLLQTRATFVTIKKRGELRGCIGTLVAVESLVDSVCANAVNAAFHDHRFSPVTKDELDELKISISVLTPPTELLFAGGDDLIKKIRPHIDGVVLRKGGRSATFLPQVWEQLPDAELFLSHLCHKAGLAQDAWRDEGVDINIYQVLNFSEEE